MSTSNISNIQAALAKLRAAKPSVTSESAVPIISNEEAVANVLDNIPAVVSATKSSTPIGTTGNAINVLEVQSKLTELSEKILTAHPLMPVLLRTIHTQLRKDPEIVTLLSEEEIGIFVNGLKMQTNTVLVTTAAKSVKSQSEKAKLKNLTADDL